TDPLLIRQGDRVQIELVNQTMMWHPMHLHGHFFRVLQGAGERAPLKHTVNVAPRETVRIEFTADNPGRWIFHCHNLYHLEAGWARVSDQEPCGKQGGRDRTAWAPRPGIDPAKGRFVGLFFQGPRRWAPLLLIMGLAADSTAWMFQVPDFAQHYRTIVFDNRGVGRTSKPAGPYTIHEMADDAARLLDVLDVPRAHVVGVS